MSLTASQQQAVIERGNVLVVAGAGTGKTSTLVERCLHCMSEGEAPASLDEILMVTFTEAAATEMRHRIRARLEELRDGKKDALRWEEQLSLFETAHFGTLHSFCLKLIRQHFYELELDPQVVVLTQEDARLQAGEVLDKILKRHYSGESDNAEAVQELIEIHGRGNDLLIRSLVLRLHDYSQTLRDPAKWFADQLAMYGAEKPVLWREWLGQGIIDWAKSGGQMLGAVPSDNLKAAQVAGILQSLSAPQALPKCDELLLQILSTDDEWPKGKKGAWRPVLKTIYDDTAFLHSLTRGDGKVAPLDQDWQWVHGQMVTLLELTREFSRDFSTVKRELAGLDFHDLEQFALKLLRDADTGQPSVVANEWRRRLKFVFVDEYQDINEAQDAILSALSREGADANRFLVGDVKQSIYRFRLADPRIFQRYMHDWRGGAGKSIALSDNFRSREGVLAFVNSLFSLIMTGELGGVVYDENAKLIFGNSEERTRNGLGWNASPRVELHLRVTGGEEESPDSGEPEHASAAKEWFNLEESSREARMAALRLRQLKDAKHLIWDGAKKMMREVEWSDMAVLMRAPSDKMECYAREFSRLNVPLTVSRGGFYSSLEIMDLLSLLQILDNPLQDIPALAVLRSPLVGMTVDELAQVRLALPKARIWSALLRFLAGSPRPEDAAWRKAKRFVDAHAHWRRLARQVSLSRCLERVVQETHYADWLLTQPQGEQSRANVERLLVLARQFDQFQRQSLARFLRFVEVQQSAETEPKVAAISGENAVVLMSIHQSKGLEFPVVLVADMAKKFNFQDLRSDIILDNELGLCPQIKPARQGRRYASLPHWLARQHLKKEMLGEELRLLYVALTRARDTLLLTGSVTQKNLEEVWPDLAHHAAARVASAKSYLDWLACWIYGGAGLTLSPASGSSPWLSWELYGENDARLTASIGAATESQQPHDENSATDPSVIVRLRQRLEAQYPHLAATRQLAKTTVTQIRKQLADEAEAAPLMFEFDRRRAGAVRKSKGDASPRLTAAEVGTLHHKFLARLDLDKSSTLAGLQSELQRLVTEGVIAATEASELDLKSIARFWASDLGGRIRAHSGLLERELAFTARFATDELRELHETGHAPGGQPQPGADEFVVVQGIADLVIIGEKELWLLDYKTDTVPSEELPHRIATYAPQVQLYAKALSRIYHRPVTHAWLYFLSHGIAEAVEVK